MSFCLKIILTTGPGTYYIVHMQNETKWTAPPKRDKNLMIPVSAEELEDVREAAERSRAKSMAGWVRGLIADRLAQSAPTPTDAAQVFEPTPGETAPTSAPCVDPGGHDGQGTGSV